MPKHPSRVYTLPFTNEVNTAAVAERVSFLADRREKFAQAPRRAVLEQVAMGEVRAMAGREQDEFAALGNLALVIDEVDAQIARLALKFLYPTGDRDAAIDAFADGRPALLSRASYHNQAAANYLYSIHAGDKPGMSDMEHRRDIARDCLPYYVALNDAGRKLLADLNARFSQFQLAAE